MTTVSAPGKVLIAGGYLVLDQQYSGLVVAATSRFYTVIKAGQRKNLVRVRSPQFVNANWAYDVAIGKDEGVEASPIVLDDTTPKNKFVHLAVSRALQVVKELKGIDGLESGLGQGLDIVILGNNDFYSQRAQLEKLGLPRKLESLKKIPPFVPLGVPIEQVHKTGMGSSAALITSLVGALLIHLNAVDAENISDVNDKGLRLIHNVAQYIHCLAQGKVGSGFDVASAIFGSHVYTRFNPAVIKPLMDSTDSVASLLPTLSPDNSQWDYKIGTVRLPPYTRLLLADVDAGSDTPSMASKVLKWRKDSGSEATDLWNNLDRHNMALVKALGKLVDDFHRDNMVYIEAVRQMGTVSASKWHTIQAKAEEITKVISDFKDTHELFQLTRAEMKKMGELSGVPIEPPQQTKLLDACIECPGIIGGGVPGAGGFDAIWVLAVDLEDSSIQSAIDEVEKVWLGWTEMSVSPLMAEASNERGLRIESETNVEGLLEAIRAQHDV